MSDGRPDEHGLVELLTRLQLLPDPKAVHQRVEELRAAHPGESAETLAKRQVRATVLRCSGVGVVAGLPGAIPGLGTFAQACATLGIASGEAAILMRNVAGLQYCVAGLYGHDLHAPERVDELLVVAGLQSGAILPAQEAGMRVGTKIAARQLDRHANDALVRKINTRLGATLLAKLGVKRGGVALGRLLPFGVGATIGGSVNFVMMRSFGHATLRYYGQIQPRDEMLFVPDTADD